MTDDMTTPDHPRDSGGEGRVWTLYVCDGCGWTSDEYDDDPPCSCDRGEWDESPPEVREVEVVPASEASRLREERDEARKALDELERVSTPLPDADYLPSHECPMCPDSGPENPCLDPDHLSHQATYWHTVSEEWRTRAERAEAERDELGVDLDDALIALRAIFRILNDPDIPDPTARTRAKLKTRPFLASLNQTEGGE